jgi:hypothetical protein
MSPSQVYAREAGWEMEPDERIDGGLIVAGCIGLCLGLASAAWLSTLYPPTRGHVWPIATVSTGSIVIVLVLYAVAARLDIRRAGDWLVLGYGVALVLAAGLVVAIQIFGVLRDHLPQNVGVKTSARSCVEPSNDSRGSCTQVARVGDAGRGSGLIPPWGLPPRVFLHDDHKPNV